MLNLFKIKKQKQKQLLLFKNNNLVLKNKFFNPSNQEWSNVLYNYNYNISKNIISNNTYIFKIIKSHFNIFSNKFNRLINSNNLELNERLMYLNNTLLSKPEFKHNNDKLIINIYMYNRQKLVYLRKLKNLKILFKKLYTSNKKIIYLNSFNTSAKFIYLYKNITLENNLIKFFNKNIINKFNINYNIYINKNSIIRKKYSKFIELFYNKYNDKLDILIPKTEKILFRYELLYISIKKILLFNKIKYNDSTLLLLKKLLTKIYKKEIEFNLIELKKPHYNSSIITQIIAKKISDRNNKYMKVLSKSISRVKWPFKNKFLYNYMIFNKPFKQNTYFNSINNIDLLDQFLNENIFDNKKIGVKNILNNLNNKIINGIKIQASGRITKRLIASRAVHRFKQIGTIKNINSSYRGLSTIVLRGNFKSSLQYNKLNNKGRIGAFGIKGWVSSM